jgi:hypothetical protein
MLIISGSVFSERTSLIRICYTVKDEVLKKGVALLCKLAGSKAAKG